MNDIKFALEGSSGSLYSAERPPPGLVEGHPHLRRGSVRSERQSRLAGIQRVVGSPGRLETFREGTAGHGPWGSLSRCRDEIHRKGTPSVRRKPDQRSGAVGSRTTGYEIWTTRNIKRPYNGTDCTFNTLQISIGSVDRHPVLRERRREGSIDSRFGGRLCSAE